MGEIRRLARQLGDSLPVFQPLRTKIHSYPGPEDVAAVARFARTADLEAPALLAKLEALLETLRAHYGADARDRLIRFLTAAPFQGAWRDRLHDLIRALDHDGPASGIKALARLSAELRALLNRGLEGQ